MDSLKSPLPPCKCWGRRSTGRPYYGRAEEGEAAGLAGIGQEQGWTK